MKVRSLTACCRLLSSPPSAIDFLPLSLRVVPGAWRVPSKHPSKRSDPLSHQRSDFPNASSMLCLYVQTEASMTSLKSVADKQVLYLTTVGRRTGLPREIEIWFVVWCERLYLFAETGEAAGWV